MNVLELFAGSCSVGKAAKELNMRVFSSDNDPKFETDYTVDILKFDVSKVPFKPDIIWASPPCESFSVSKIAHHWREDNTPKTESARRGVEMVKKTLEIIEYFSPVYFFIENPRGKLRKLDFMQHLDRKTVMYCRYGDDRMKPTDIWTNNKRWIPRPVCTRNGTDHISAPRGSVTGTQGRKTYADRSKIPHELCVEILEACIIQ